MSVFKVTVKTGWPDHQSNNNDADEIDEHFHPELTYSKNRLPGLISSVILNQSVSCFYSKS